MLNLEADQTTLLSETIIEGAICTCTILQNWYKILLVLFDTSDIFRSLFHINIHLFGDSFGLLSVLFKKSNKSDNEKAKKNRNNRFKY